ncbi:MAG: membrane protein insertase YidC [Sarcina sp.]
MTKILSPITGIFTKIFDVLFSFVHGFGVDKGTSYVLAVVLLTVLVRLLILPLTMKQMKSQAGMQEIQPLIKEIQQKYKGNPEKLNMETMRIYKENNVSMAGGCLPLVIQMPILFALYYVFFGLAGTKGVSFLWIPNLQGHDPYYILPVLSGLSTFLSSYLMTKSSAQGGQSGPINMGAMNIGMAIMLGVMSLNFPALLVIYWIVGNLIQIIQTYFLMTLPMKKRMKAKAEAAGVVDVTPKKNSSKKKKK